MVKHSAHRFYTYVLIRPWNEVPCYVGKGQDDRVNDHTRMGEDHYNPHLANIFKKAGGSLPFEIAFSSDDEDEAFAAETRLILSIGRADLGLGPLANHTNGGEGSSGRIFSKETREILSNRAVSYRVSLSLEQRATEDAAKTAYWVTLSIDQRRHHLAAASVAAVEANTAIWAGLNKEQRLQRLAPAHTAAHAATRATCSALDEQQRKDRMALAIAGSTAAFAAMSSEQKTVRLAALQAGREAYQEKQRAEKVRLQAKREQLLPTE